MIHIYGLLIHGRSYMENYLIDKYGTVMTLVVSEKLFMYSTPEYRIYIRAQRALLFATRASPPLYCEHSESMSVEDKHKLHGRNHGHSLLVIIYTAKLACHRYTSRT